MKADTTLIYILQRHDANTAQGSNDILGIIAELADVVSSKQRNKCSPGIEAQFVNDMETIRHNAEYWII